MIVLKRLTWLPCGRYSIRLSLLMLSVKPLAQTSWNLFWTGGLLSLDATIISWSQMTTGSIFASSVHVILLLQESRYVSPPFSDS